MGVRQGEIVVHAAGFPVLIQPGATTNRPAGDNIQEMTDDGRRAVIRCGTNAAPSLQVELDRRKGRLLIQRYGSANLQFWCQGEPKRDGNRLKWQNGTTLLVREGQLAEWSPNGYSGGLAVGNGLLPLKDPAPGSHPLVTLAPDAAGSILIEIIHRR